MNDLPPNLDSKILCSFLKLPTLIMSALCNPTVRRVLVSIVIAVVLLSIIGFLVVTYWYQILIAAMAIALIVFVVGHIRGIRAEQEAAVRKNEEERAAKAADNARVVRDKNLERGKRTLRMALSAVLSTAEASNLGLILPPRESDIPSAKPDTSKYPVVFAFSFAKSVDTVNTDDIAEYLNTMIETKAEAGSLAGISKEPYQYKGLVYPRIYVDRVIDNNPNFVEIDMIYMVDEYAEYLRLGGAKDFSFANQATTDKDF